MAGGFFIGFVPVFCNWAGMLFTLSTAVDAESFWFFVGGGLVLGALAGSVTMAVGRLGAVAIAEVSEVVRLAAYKRRCGLL